MLPLLPLLLLLGLGLLPLAHPFLPTIRLHVEPHRNSNTPSHCSTARIYADPVFTLSHPHYLNLTSSLTPTDLSQISLYWRALNSTITHLPSSSHTTLTGALTLAYSLHLPQTRKSGQPYIIHPVSVAILLAELHMDEASIVAGLLHDTVEDTPLTLEALEGMFGGIVRAIVEGETKVSKLPSLASPSSSPSPSSKDDEQAENLRSMFLAMTDDYRIIIVKLADRLHNMRTLEHMSLPKQQKIARETLEIFSPLAHRMGIWQFKSELEDLSFRFLYPDEYQRLSQMLTKNKQNIEDALASTLSTLQDVLASEPTLKNVNVTITGRTKELYSLYLKMNEKSQDSKNRHSASLASSSSSPSLPLDSITDVVAVRIVLDTTPRQNETENEYKTRSVWLCYHVLGLVQHLPNCTPVSGAVKDYISFPKQNNYQSLHTAVLNNNQIVEVQIRTSEMHRVAEVGLAAHWVYQSSKLSPPSLPNSLPQQTPFLSTIKEWQTDKLTSHDFVESVRRELLGKRVFIFLRNGRILNLARGVTALDAAFHINLGLTLLYVEINGNPVSLSYELQNGDIFNVFTGPGAPPSLDWLEHARSRSTRDKLLKFLGNSNATSTLNKHGGADLPDLLAADPHHICAGCLPVPGDDIVGTRPNNNEDDSPVVTHRRECIHAQRSLEASSRRSMNISLDMPVSNTTVLPSSVLNERFERFSSQQGSAFAFAPAEAVAVTWSETLKVNNDIGEYKCELRVFAAAPCRSHLLQDSLAAVFEHARVLQSRQDMSNSEHCRLDFRVLVKGVDHMQRIMDALQLVPGVMSVERAWGGGSFKKANDDRY